MTDRFLFNLAHLARRFFGHVTAAPLGPDEQVEVRDLLNDARLAALFFAQAPPDQRHAYGVALRFRQHRPQDHAGIQAALLHDIGKRRSSVGAVGRSLATAMEAFRLPLPQAWRDYRNHGALGADELKAVGADALTVAFARHHPGAAPTGCDPSVWQALLDADDV